MARESLPDPPSVAREAHPLAEIPRYRLGGQNGNMLVPDPNGPVMTAGEVATAIACLTAALQRVRDVIRAKRGSYHPASENGVHIYTFIDDLEAALSAPSLDTQELK